MRNPNKPVKNIDDTEKSKTEIKKIIDDMMKTDENGYPEENNRRTA